MKKTSTEIRWTKRRSGESREEDGVLCNWRHSTARGERLVKFSTAKVINE